MTRRSTSKTGTASKCVLRRDKRWPRKLVVVLASVALALQVTAEAIAQETPSADSNALPVVVAPPGAPFAPIADLVPYDKATKALKERPQAKPIDVNSFLPPRAAPAEKTRAKPYEKPLQAMRARKGKQASAPKAFLPVPAAAPRKSIPKRKTLPPATEGKSFIPRRDRPAGWSRDK